ncbi:GAD-like domain-containing protein [Nocardia sp. NPDC004068]|uniref:GAD-like domain-containing protein n=1 Tax=Nocardia sp. NPDC004068 TaxID=3364303 RepID=UPI0036A5B174
MRRRPLGTHGCRRDFEVSVPFSIGQILRVWGEPTVSVPASVDQIEKFSPDVPGFLVDVWQEVGFSGFMDGLLWLCDPEAWQPAVDAWVSKLELPFGDDRWIAVTRSAFGEMSLWGRRTGMSLTVVPYSGWILPFDGSGEMSSAFDRDNQVYSALAAANRETLDLLGDDGKPLFGRVLAALGPVGPETMYGFVPAPALGGALLPENVEIVDAEVHMQILSQVTPRTIMADNPYL